MNTRAQPVGGPILTRPFRVLAVLFGLGALLIVWRYAVGLGPSTGMSDGYPFGLWIAFDVVTGTALACGGYAMAILVYILNKGRYHPLVRPAIVTSALGYTIAGVSVLVDVGRPWLLWKVPLFGWEWNFNSVMLEVALCIMAYVVVLWIELAPAFLEAWEDSEIGVLRRFSRNARPILERALLWIVALGVLLPTMHQSSLGSLMMLAGHKLHPLFNTPMLPLLFLVSCISMGYAAVVLESSLSTLLLKREPETDMLSRLFGACVVTIGIFLVLRFGELAFQGRLGYLGEPSVPAVMFWVEAALLVGAGLLWFDRTRRRQMGQLFRAAVLVALAGALYRFDTYLVAYDPGPAWTYFPAVPEILVTVGLVALEIMVYAILIKRFPILAGRPRRPPKPATMPPSPPPEPMPLERIPGLEAPGEREPELVGGPGRSR